MISGYINLILIKKLSHRISVAFFDTQEKIGASKTPQICSLEISKVYSSVSPTYAVGV